VAAGAEAVVAAVRPVPDDLGAALASALYAGAARPDWDVATAFAAAQRALSRDRPDADWAAYRLFTR
jgi:CHAT domain-containing protein